ncbi:MAG: hypothetical protein WA194_07445 [Patescibacteria group bacterium]
MSDKRQESPEKRVPKSAPESKETPNESTVGHLVALVKCKAMGVCEKAETKKKTDDLKRSMEGEKTTAVKIDLSPL